MIGETSLSAGAMGCLTGAGGGPQENSDGEVERGCLLGSLGLEGGGGREGRMTLICHWRLQLWGKSST